MRLKGRQGRFLGVTIGGWIVARAWLLWPVAPLAIGGAVTTVRPPEGRGVPAAVAPPSREALLRVARPIPSARSSAVALAAGSPSRPDQRDAAPGMQAMPFGFGGAAPRPERQPPDAEADRVSPSRAPPTANKRAVEGQAYLFVRPGSGRAALAPGGSLGASQAAARVAVALNPTGPVRTAAAARVYAPLRGKGAEVALGLDWHPLTGVPVRVSVERRIGLDRAGRDAWSAYAAGGFFAGHLPLGLEADGYAQAGVVGVRSRDLFADGAVRIGRRAALGPIEAVLGAGTWGAAQPGAARVDVGPRLALGLPVDRHRLTLAVEGRLRIAGRAAPGSGAALTLAADF